VVCFAYLVHVSSDLSASCASRLKPALAGGHADHGGGLPQSQETASCFALPGSGPVQDLFRKMKVSVMYVL
jgi:hypothetical protein